MPHSISGNCGVAGATVYFLSQTTFAGGGTVLSDGSGNYTTGAVLPDDTYQVQVRLPGYSFTSSGQSFSNQTVSGADVPGVNFTATPISLDVSFAPIIADSFQRANEDPLSNGGNWITFFDPTPATGDHAIIKNNECEIQLTSSEDGGALWVGSSLPNDQYIEVQLNHLNQGGLDLYVRSGLFGGNQPAPSYNLYLAGGAFDAWSTFGGSTLYSLFEVTQFNSTGSGNDYAWDAAATSGIYQAFKAGDVIRFGVMGGATGFLYVLLNGQLIYKASLALAVAASAPLLSSGHVGFQLFSVNSPQTSADIGVINFKGGSVSAMSTAPFLGSVRVVSSAPAGAKDNFLGTVHVVGSAPAGNTNPYLGQIKEVLVAPAGNTNPSLGDVVVVGSAPAGDSDPYLGSVISG